MSGDLHHDSPRLINFHLGQEGGAPEPRGPHKLAGIDAALNLARTSIEEHGGKIGRGTDTATFAIRFASEVAGVEMYEEPRQETSYSSKDAAA